MSNSITIIAKVAICLSVYITFILLSALLYQVQECRAVYDTTCDCPEGTFQIGPTECTPMPLCDEDYERKPIRAGNYLFMIIT